MAMDSELFGDTRVPECKNDVKLNSSGDGIECSECKVVYPIKTAYPSCLSKKRGAFRRGMSAKILFDLLSYAAFRVFLRVLAILPLSVAACAGAFLGAVVFALGIRKGLL